MKPVLESGYVASSPTVVYQVPRGARVTLQQVRVYNPDAATQTVVFSLNIDGQAVPWGRAVLEQYEAVDFLEQEVVISEADAVLLSSTDADKAAFHVHGELKREAL